MAGVHTALYEVLNVTSAASVPEIKKAYKKLAKEFHPDKNPLTADKFKEISFAHEVLTDPQRRSVYDQYGMKGLQKGHRGESSASYHDDLFSHFFGGGLFGMNSGMGCSRYSNRQQRSEDSIYPLKVTLEDLYNGKSFKFFINKNVICATCKGNGTKSGMRHVCCKCFGSGMRVQGSHPILFMMQQQVQVPCIDCKGQGSVIPDRDCCDRCHGQKTYSEKKRMEVFVEKGMRDSQKIILLGEGNQVLGMEPGDVLVILQEQPHETFRRSGEDLYVTKEISLTEALCGFSFGLTHLDGRVLRIVQPAGVCIKNGQIRGIEHEGMPSRTVPTERGNLYIKFNVAFPPNYFANETQLKVLETLLGPRPEFSMPTGEDTEEVDLHDFTPSDNTSATSGDAHSEDEDDYYYGGQFGPGSNVQCAQQ